MKFKEPLTFKCYGAVQSLRLVDMGKRLFALPDGGSLVRRRPDKLFAGEFEVVPPADPESAPASAR